MLRRAPSLSLPVTVVQLPFLSMFDSLMFPRRSCAVSLAAACLLLCAHARADDAGDVTRLFRAGQTAQAFARLDRLLEAQPKDSQLRFLKGVMQSNALRIDEAVNTFRQLNEDYPDLPEPYNNLAVIHAARGDYLQARVALESALTANPSYAVAHQNLAEVLLQMARQSYARAGQLEPENAGVAARLALLRQLTLPEAKPRSNP
jgi:Flp pilus assembly protein TadD